MKEELNGWRSDLVQVQKAEYLVVEIMADICERKVSL